MKKNSHSLRIVFLAVIALTLFVFRFWLTPNLMFGGDFFFPPFLDQSEKLPAQPFAWDMQKGAGLGGQSMTTMWIDTYSQVVPNLLLRSGLHPVIVQKIVFQIPLLLIGFLGSAMLYRTVFPLSDALWPLAPLIFLLNTYAIMVISGGQMGVALAYAVTPLVLVSFIKIIESVRYQRAGITYFVLGIKETITAGLVLAVQVWFDLRIAYISLLALALYFVFRITYQGFYRGVRITYYVIWLMKIIPVVFLIPLGIAGLLHSFWVVPLIISRINPVAAQGAVYTSQSALQFFSFADFSHAIALLHANWPENIFGKTYFLQPEFLVLPILAYGSLLFLGKAGSITYYVLRIKDERKVQKSESQNRYILFFALLGLLGAFLAKGANPPFGGVYVWLFDHIPGFVMFRDASKFYVLTAISYSVLIPYMIGAFSEWLHGKSITYNVLRIKKLKNLNTKYLILSTLFLLFWAFTIRQAVTGQVRGLLKPKTIEQDYTVLKNLLLSDRRFERTLTVPTRQRYVYFSRDYSSIDGASLLQTNSVSAILAWFNNESSQEQLSRWAVKYVVVPTDPDSEIFLTDRKYDASIREQVLQRLQSIPWLTEKPGFESLGVFETADRKSHFWLEDREGNNAKMQVLVAAVNPTRYEISVGAVPEGTRLIFSEAFDSNWILVGSGEAIPARSTEDGLNSFDVPAGTSFTIFYKPQKYVEAGTKASFATGIALLALLLWILRRMSR